MINSYSGWPGKVVAGSGALYTLGDEIKALGGGRTMIFTDSFLSQLPIVRAAIEAIEKSGVQTCLFDRVGPNPTDLMVEDGVKCMQEFQPDCIVCIGGGSPIDCAKACNVVYTHGGRVQDYNVNTGGVERIENKLLPFIAVPTTSGTGSEVTNVGVITDTARHVKFGVLSPFNVPNVAVLDPDITLELSPDITANTGIDALTHCIESYVSLVDFCIADAEALEGIRMIRKYLPIAYADGRNVEAREKMMMASMMAGASFNINNLGLCHQMAHQLSGYFNLAHGLANAMLLSRVMRFNLKARPERFAAIAEALGCDIRGLDAEAAGLKGIEAVEELTRSLGIPEYLDEVGVTKDQVPAMAVTALEDGVGATNPVATTVEQCEALFYSCFKA